MSYESSSSQAKTSAESRYRAAFERLKQGRPVIVPMDTAISLASVAREAGSDPSSIKRSRYPDLAHEISQFTSTDSSSTLDPKLAAARRKIQRLESRLRDVQRQRDHAISLLLAAERELMDRTRRCAGGTAETVVQFRSHKGGLSKMLSKI